MEKFEGYELTILMAEEKIKDGDTFKCLDTKDTYKYDINHGLIRIDNSGIEKDFIDSIYSPAVWLNFTFVKESINIQELTEIDNDSLTIETINQIIRAVKQLDKKLHEEYCINCSVKLDDNNRALPNMCNECKYGIDWEEKN